MTERVQGPHYSDPLQKGRAYDVFEWDRVGFRNEVEIGAALYYARPPFGDEEERFVWGRTTGITLHVDSIPTLLKVLLDAYAEAKLEEVKER